MRISLLTNFLLIKYLRHIIILAILLQFSCVKDIDTEQLKEQNLIIPMELALIDLNVKGDAFSGNLGTNVSVPYLIDFRGFFYESETERIDFISNLSNSFDEQISITYQFRDYDSILLPLRLYHEIKPNTINEIQSIPIEGDYFEDFKKARIINATVSYNGFPIGLDEADSVAVQSKLSFDYILPLE